jgi:nicotinamide riboside transporter PnuC
MDWLIAALVFTTSYLYAKKRRAGWVLSFINNALFVGMMMHQRQWGFVVSGTGLALMAVYGWWSWRPEKEMQDG